MSVCKGTHNTVSMTLQKYKTNTSRVITMVQSTAFMKHKESVQPCVIPFTRSLRFPQLANLKFQLLAHVISCGFKQFESQHMTEGTESAFATGDPASIPCSRGPDRLNHISNYQHGQHSTIKACEALGWLAWQISEATKQCLEEMLLPYFFPSPSQQPAALLGLIVQQQCGAIGKTIHCR